MTRPIPDAALVLVPFDSGRHEWRMGKGPAVIARHLQAAAGPGASFEIAVVEVSAPESYDELAASIGLYREVGVLAAALSAQKKIPIVLSGNCAASLGTVACTEGVGVIWFDAHGDFNTPDTSATGFLDGMSLAALTGECWREHTASIPGFLPVPGIRIAHVGGRDFDPHEEHTLASKGISVVRGDVRPRQEYWRKLAVALDSIARHAKRVHIHLDLDVVDASEGRANSYAAGGGLTREELLDSLSAITQRFEIASLGISAYDPDFDPGGSIATVATEAVETVRRSR